MADRWRCWQKEGSRWSLFHSWSLTVQKIVSWLPCLSPMTAAGAQGKKGARHWAAQHAGRTAAAGTAAAAAEEAVTEAAAANQYTGTLKYSWRGWGRENRTATSSSGHAGRRSSRREANMPRFFRLNRKTEWHRKVLRNRRGDLRRKTRHKLNRSGFLGCKTKPEHDHTNTNKHGKTKTNYQEVWCLTVSRMKQCKHKDDETDTTGFYRHKQPNSTQSIHLWGLTLEKTRGLWGHTWDHHTCEANISIKQTEWCSTWKSEPSTYGHLESGEQRLNSSLTWSGAANLLKTLCSSCVLPPPPQRQPGQQEFH